MTAEVFFVRSEEHGYYVQGSPIEDTTKHQVHPTR